MGNQKRVITDGESIVVDIDNPEHELSIDAFMVAVGKFLLSNDVSFLYEFEGRYFIDTLGDKYIFETVPNKIYHCVDIMDFDSDYYLPGRRDLL